MEKTDKKRVLILYAEVMGYVTRAILEYLKLYDDRDILLIELDKAKLTNYKFKKNGFDYEKKSNPSGVSSPPLCGEIINLFLCDSWLLCGGVVHFKTFLK